MIRRLTFASFVAGLAACSGTDEPVLTPVDSAMEIDAPSTARAWTLVTHATTTDLYAVSGTSATDVIAVGGSPGTTAGMPGVAITWDGTNWVARPNLVNLLAVAGPVAVGEYGGEGSESHWSGGAWSSREVLGAGSLRGAWTTSPGSYAVGDGGQLHYTTETTIPGSWTSLTSNTTFPLDAVWGSSPSDVYAVGARGTIVHNTGAGVGGTGTWVVTTYTGLNGLTGVWGSGATDVYIVGNVPPVILHSTSGGASWNPTTPPAACTTLDAISGRAADDIYVACAGGVILHSSGGDAWTVEPTPTTADLLGIWAAASGDVYAVGRGGTILHKTP